MGDSNLLATFTYVAEQLKKRNIAFICAREAMRDDWFAPILKKSFGGVYIANEGFTKETAEDVIVKEKADAVAFGQLFIANPDLPYRFKTGAPLNAPDTSTFFAGAVNGYTDYPFVHVS